jgi:hypothetical protein
MVHGMNPSHLWLRLSLLLTLFSLSRSRETGGLWDCQVTPAYCTCQERNTIGCILNNDGLDAGLPVRFSTTRNSSRVNKSLSCWNQTFAGWISDPHF